MEQGGGEVEEENKKEKGRNCEMGKWVIGSEECRERGRGEKW